MAFDIGTIIKQPNVQLGNVRKTTGDFTSKVSDIKGNVNQAKGAVQSATRQYESTKEQINSGIGDLKDLVGIKQSTSEFEQGKTSSNAADKRIEAGRDADMFNARKKDISTPAFDSLAKRESNDLYNRSLPQTSSNKHIGMELAHSVLRNWGVAKTNRFRVEIELPRVFTIAKSTFRDGGFELPDFSNTVMGELFINLTIEGFALPGINFDTQFTNYGGFKTQIATGYNVDDVPMTMRCSATMIQKNFFDQWASCVYNFEKGGFRFYDDYASTIKIYQLNELDEDVYGVMLQGAYPKSSTTLDLNAADQSMYHRLNVQWAYERYLPLPINQPKTNNPEQNEQRLFLYGG